MTSRPRCLSEESGALADRLEPVFESGSPAEIRRVLKRVARAHGVSVLARETGLTREAIYKALGDHGNPTLDTLSRLLDAMELRLSVRAARVSEKAHSACGPVPAGATLDRRSANPCVISSGREESPQPDAAAEKG
jgi:probable addiction module antidote protein